MWRGNLPPGLKVDGSSGEELDSRRLLLPFYFWRLKGPQVSLDSGGAVFQLDILGAMTYDSA